MKISSNALEQNAVLSSWSGVPVKIWDYSVTHKKLALRGHERGLDRALYVICLGCISISGPFTWKDASLEVVPVIDESVDCESVLVRDSCSGFELWCERVLVCERAAADLDFPFDITE